MGERLVSLDAFRGLTILLMLFVNNTALGERTPALLTHAGWGHIFMADLVFPWFILALGMAVPFSWGSSLRKGLSRRAFLAKAFRRTFWLILLGLFLDSSLAHVPLLGLGVLQLLGLDYAVCALLVGQRLSVRAAIAASGLLLHWGLLMFFPVPDVGMRIFSENVNIVRYLDQTFLSPLHLRGLVSVLPTASLALAGSCLGELLSSPNLEKKKRGCLLGICGGLMVAGGFAWSFSFPFSKDLWTGSFILVTGGLGVLVLTFFYWIEDIRGIVKPFFPLVVFGMNAIAAYVLPIVVKIYILQGWGIYGPPGSASPSLQEALIGFLTSFWGPTWGGWAYTIGYVVVWWLVFYGLHRKGLFLKI